MSLCSRPIVSYILLFLVFLEAITFLTYITTITEFWLGPMKSSPKTANDANFAFGFLVSSTPLLSSFLADNYFGRGKMISAHLFIFIFAFTVLTASLFLSSSFAVILGATGLLSVAVSEGINRTVVPTFNADQFDDKDEESKNSSFAWYYVVVNIAGLCVLGVSSLKDLFECFGGKCWALTYGVCIGCVLLATVIFLLCTKMYKKVPLSANVVVLSFKCIFCAILGRGDSDGEAESPDQKSPISTSKSKPTDTWLDRAYPRFTWSFIQNVLQVLRTSCMFFIGIPFWTLFQTIFGGFIQQFLQSNAQFGRFTFTPMTYLTANPVSVIILIILLNYVIYPLLGKCFKVTYLKKMAAGGFICLLTYCFIINVEYKIIADQPPVLSGDSRVVAWSQADLPNCDVKLVSSAGKATVLKGGKGDADFENGDFQIEYSTCPNVSLFVKDPVLYRNSISSTVTVKPGVNVLALYPGVNASVVEVFVRRTEYSRVEASRTEVNFMSCRPGKTKVYLPDASHLSDNKIEAAILTRYSLFQTLYRDMMVGDCSGPSKCLKHRIDLKSTMGSRIQYFDKYNCHGANSSVTGVDKVFLVKPFTVHLGWLYPQLIAIALAEAVLAVTALEFAYNQTSASMKTVVQAYWMVTAALGSLIGLLLNQFGFPEITVHWIGGGVTLVMTVLFVIASCFYKYVKFEENGDIVSEEEE